MSESPTFEWAATAIEQALGWTRIVARGTVRLVLKEMGLDPRTIGKQEMTVCLKKALVDALQARGVPEPHKVCAELQGALLKADLAGAPDSPQDIFRRLAGSIE